MTYTSTVGGNGCTTNCTISGVVVSGIGSGQTGGATGGNEGTSGGGTFVSSPTSNIGMGLPAGSTIPTFGERQSFGNLFLERLMSGEVRDDIFDYGTGFGEGVISVAKGVGNSFRFLGRGTGLMGGDEQSRWQAEGLAIDVAAKAYATNGVVRSEVNAALYDEVSANASALNIGRFVGRSITGFLLAPAGALAAIGDGTRAVERAGMSATDALNRIIFGY